MEYDDTTDFPGAYRVLGYPGVAWYVWGNYAERNEDTEWSGLLTVDHDSVVATMAGDDRHFRIPVEDLEEIEPEDYCSGCGQIGCPHGA